MRFNVIVLFFSLLCACHSTQNIPKMKAFPDYPAYGGNDLGMNVSKAGIRFVLWSPAAEAVRLYLYENGSGGTALETINLEKASKGTWKCSLSPASMGRYYTVQVQSGGVWLDETPDPYAKAVGVNGKRGMILDLAGTNPPGWDKDARPALAKPTDIVLYELHIRDFSIHPNAGMKNAGKYLAFTETGTKNSQGLATGIDHLKDLGITHLHLLPTFDYRSVDESNPKAAYNWGYDPENYNAPEGSYASDATDGAVRIREFKRMVQALHANGIRVVMDVVYNHTGATEASVFNRCVPGYYYRQKPDGSFSNASACGNETASEREMMRQYIIQSVLYWVQEYHIDGFRFDLMGIHDIETMNQVSEALRRVDPSIFVYGEGWTAGDSPLPVEKRALKAHVPQLNHIAAFSDDFRDALKGSVFDHKDRGFATGKPGMEESIKFGIVASLPHPQVDYSKVNYSKAPWAKQPEQTITYAECHDNHTLWDRLVNSMPAADEAERIKMHQLTTTMVLTSQGVPFLHAGMELLRTKNGEENSFDKPDEVNRMDWDRKSRYTSTFDLYKSLIRLRKNHPAFRMSTTEQITKHLRFLPVEGSNLVAYQLSDHANGDSWKNILVIFNGSDSERSVALPPGNWNLILQGPALDENGLRPISGDRVSVPARMATILSMR
jgi:pullulanase